MDATLFLEAHPLHKLACQYASNLRRDEAAVLWDYLMGTFPDCELYRIAAAWNAMEANKPKCAIDLLTPLYDSERSEVLFIIGKSHYLLGNLRDSSDCLSRYARTKLRDASSICE